MFLSPCVNIAPCSKFANSRNLFFLFDQDTPCGICDTCIKITISVLNHCRHWVLQIHYNFVKKQKQKQEPTM